VLRGGRGVGGGGGDGGAGEGEGGNGGEGGGGGGKGRGVAVGSRRGGGRRVHVEYVLGALNASTLDNGRWMFRVFGEVR